MKIKINGVWYFKITPQWVKGYRPVSTYVRIS